MSDLYESDKLLSEYLLFHYGTTAEILPPVREWPSGMIAALDFPARTVAHFSTTPVSRGLDLGCAVGRSTFEMTRHCTEVVGIDYSHAFIAAAQALQRGESLVYQRRDEAAATTQLTAHLPAGVDPTRTHFHQGDAMMLPANLGKFDRVHASNLLCRLREPIRLLKRLPELVAPGGELVLATPCTWLEEFTPQENWPPAGTFDWLTQMLSPHFSMKSMRDEPFLIRETSRKFQWTFSLVTVWRRHP